MGKEGVKIEIMDTTLSVMVNKPAEYLSCLMRN